jgi:hypothetical protein
MHYDVETIARQTQSDRLPMPRPDPVTSTLSFCRQACYVAPAAD